MKKLLVALVLFSSAAQAIPITYNIFSPQSSVDVFARFTLETSSIDSELYQVRADSFGTCLDGMSLSGIAVTDFSLQQNGQTLWSGQNLKANIQYGNNGNCPSSGFFGSFKIFDGSSIFAWNPDLLRRVSLTDLFASPDRLATILIGANYSNGFIGAQGDWGSLGLGNQPIAGEPIVSVPEPGTLGLFLLGVGGALRAGRKRRR